uniref:UPAR/Ly6 domain-containing protein n=1 Tax=Parastrongyloides trichosuri TaxID=131310 RepID=A0A0N4ZTU7_PARTI
MLFSHLVILLTIFLIVDHSIALKCYNGFNLRIPKEPVEFIGTGECEVGVNFCIFATTFKHGKGTLDIYSCDFEEGVCEEPGEIKDKFKKKMMITHSAKALNAYNKMSVNELTENMFAFCCMGDSCNKKPAFSGSSSNNQLNEPFGKSFGKENNNYQGVLPVRYQDPYDFRSTNNFEGSNNFLHRTVFIGLWLSLIMII